MNKPVSIGDRSILVVDDEPILRLDLADFFENRGFAVFEAACADEAIAVLDANPVIRIVVTDVQMPGSMDGLKLAHFIRDRWPPTVLVIVSGAAKLEMKDLPEKASFVPKPVDPHFVLREIERIAERS